MLLCCACQTKLGRIAVLEEQSQDMEAARRAFGLEGVRFRYYCCPRCDHDNVFLMLIPLPGETHEQLGERKSALAAEIGSVTAWRTTVVVT
jgi:hypothetical protein